MSFEEREEVSRGLASGMTMRAVAKSLNRHVSTISREVRRAQMTASSYRATRAHGSARIHERRRRTGKRKLFSNPALRQYVETHLRARWSPEQIAKRIVFAYPQDNTMRISHEAIYEYVYVMPRGLLKAQLVAGMRRTHKFRHRRANRKRDRNAPETRGRNPEMSLIDERPKEADNRSLPGHWEGDLIAGKFHQSAIGTLVERTTRFTIIVPLKQKDVTNVRKAFERAFRTLPSHLRKTLTYDQGREMAQHKLFTQRTNIPVFFAHPNSPWERGTNENTNGLIRQFFPKGTDFSKVSTRRIRHAQHLLNDRPRKVLEWKTPKEAFNSLVALEG